MSTLLAPRRQGRPYLRLPYTSVPSPKVVVLISDLRKRERLTQALRHHFGLIFCADAARLVELAGIHQPRAVVVEARDTRGSPTAGVVRALRDQFPWLPIVVYCRLNAPEVRDAFAAGRHGATRIVFVDVDDRASDLRAALADSDNDCTSQRLLHHFSGRIPAPVLPIFEYCACNGHRSLTVEHLARDLGIRRQAVDSRLRNAGFTSARQVIRCFRILHAARLMEDRGLSFDRIARILEFSSGSALRATLMELTGLTPSQVRMGGGLEFVLPRLKEVLLNPRSS